MVNIRIPTTVWGVFLCGIVLAAAPALCSATMQISWGRPTAAERDANELKCIFGLYGYRAEILVYIEGMERGRTYEIEVEVKEKAADNGSDQKRELEVEDLVSTPVPDLPPADPPTPPVDPELQISFGHPTSAELAGREVHTVPDPATGSQSAELLVYIQNVEPDLVYELGVTVKEKSDDVLTAAEKLTVDDLVAIPAPELSPADPK